MNITLGWATSLHVTLLIAVSRMALDNQVDPTSVLGGLQTYVLLVLIPFMFGNVSLADSSEVRYARFLHGVQVFWITMYLIDLIRGNISLSYFSASLCLFYLGGTHRLGKGWRTSLLR